MFFFELGKPSMEGRSFGEQVLCAFFQAVTPRTAGFNTVDLTTLSGCSKILIVGLMFIGGSPGSTAGGIKTVSYTHLDVYKRQLYARTGWIIWD